MSVEVFYDEFLCLFHLDENETLFDHLITTKIANPAGCRGVHESVIDDPYVVAVFYNGVGWVDVGYKFLIKHISKDNQILKSAINKRKYVYKLKE